MNPNNPMIGDNAQETLDRLVYSSYSLVQQLDGFQGVMIENLNDIEQHDLIMKVNAAAILADCCQGAITHSYWQHSNELSATRQQLAEANKQLAEANKQIKILFDEGVKQGKRKNCTGKKKSNNKSAKKNDKPIEARATKD